MQEPSSDTHDAPPPSPNEPIELEPVAVPVRFRVGVPMLASAIACSLLVLDGGRIALAPPPPLLVVGNEVEGYRLIDTDSESMDDIASATQVISAEQAHHRFGWPRVFRSQLATSIKLRRMPDAEVAPLTDELIEQAAQRWGLDREIERRVFHGSPWTRRYEWTQWDAGNLAVDAVVWIGLGLGAWWTLRWLPLVRTNALRRERQNRLNRGLCPNCSYEVHGLDHCPECGSVWKNSAEWVNTEPPNRRGGSDS